MNHPNHHSTDRRKAHMSNTQGLLQHIFERVSDGIVALDANWCYTYVNTKAAHMLQKSKPEELVGKHIWTEYPEGIGQPFYHAYVRAMTTQEEVVFEDYYPPWDKWFENRIYPSPDGLTIYFSEITQRKKAQLSLEKANRALMVLGVCNDVLIKATNETELLHDICSVIHEVGHYPATWIGIWSGDEAETLQPVSQKGFNAIGGEQGLSDRIHGSDSDVPTATVLRTAQRVITTTAPESSENHCTDPIAHSINMASAIALPIRLNDRIHGVLSIYSDHKDIFDDDEVELLEEIANNLGLGLYKMRSARSSS